MKKMQVINVTVLLGAAITTIAMTGSVARATEAQPTTRWAVKSNPTLIADNVVVTPSAGTAAPQEVPQQAAPVQAVPVQSAPAQQTAVVESPRHTSVVHAEASSPHNYMSTIAVSGLMGGVVGLLVGGSIYFLGDQTHARNIGYWGAGGVLLGVGVGVVQVAVQESRLSNATALNRFPSDPAPTFRLALLTTRF